MPDRAEPDPAGGPDGVVAIDKPAGLTSHAVVARVRRALGARPRRGPKVGHAGTLDPSATGVLVVAVGRATRLVPWLQASRKTYEALIAFGATTDTLDADGVELTRTDASHLTEQAVCDALHAFLGPIEQIPPMVSAVKVDGERLHEKARRGEEVARDPRPVTIHDLVLEVFQPGPAPTARVLVTCSPGTYVRTLAADVGQRLGTGAHLAELRRLGSGRFDAAAALPLEKVEAAAADGRLDELLDSPAVALADLPVRRVDTAEAAALAHGQFLSATGSAEDVAALDPDGELVAILRDRDGHARPVAVFAP